MPYNPQIEYRGDRYLFGGLANAGASAGQAIEEHKRRKGEYDGLVKYADSAGIVPKDQSTTMSLDELKATLAGHAYQQVQQRQAAIDARQNRLVNAQVGNFEADNRRADEAAAVPGIREGQRMSFLDLLEPRLGESEQTGPPGPGNNYGKPVTVRELLGIARQANYPIPNAELSALMKDLGITRDPNSEAFEPRVMTKTDEDGKPVRFAVTGPKQAQVLPGEDMTPNQKRQYASSLQATRRQLLLRRTDPMVSDPETRETLDGEIQSLDAELEDLGFGRPASSKAAPIAPAAGKQAATGSAKVLTRDQWDQLPSGASYVGKDGRTYRKP